MTSLVKTIKKEYLLNSKDNNQAGINFTFDTLDKVISKLDEKSNNFFKNNSQIRLQNIKDVYSEKYKRNIQRLGKYNYNFEFKTITRYLICKVIKSENK